MKELWSWSPDFGGRLLGLDEQECVWLFLREDVGWGVSSRRGEQRQLINWSSSAQTRSKGILWKEARQVGAQKQEREEPRGVGWRFSRRRTRPSSCPAKGRNPKVDMHRIGRRISSPSKYAFYLLYAWNLVSLGRRIGKGCKPVFKGTEECSLKKGKRGLLGRQGIPSVVQECRTTPRRMKVSP